MACTTTYTYDNRDRLKTKSTPEGAELYLLSPRQLLTIVSSNTNGASMTYTYDVLNRLKTATDNQVAAHGGQRRAYHRFRVTVEPKKTAMVTIREYRPCQNRYELTNLTDDQITYFSPTKMINPEVEQALRRIASTKNSIAALDAEITSRKTQMSPIAEDQQQVRENMKALKGSTEEKALVERYARREIADLRQRKETAQKMLNEMIEGMTLEAKL